MRRGLLILMALLVISGLCAFTKGTINPGGTISYSSYKSYSDDDDAYNVLSFSPQLGYFVIDDLALDLLLNYVSQSEGDASQSGFAIGLGGRYFYKNFYGGLGLKHDMVSWDYGAGYDGSGAANFLDLKVGYLFPIVQNVYVDLGLNYDRGFGKYSGDWSGDNEESTLGLLAGFQIFFPMK
jgi:hypothetical protein